MSRINSDEIKRLRLVNGWSRRKLADSAGLSARTVERAESGRENISSYTLYSIAEALGVPYQSLTSAVDAEPKPGLAPASEPIRLTLSVEIPSDDAEKASDIVASILSKLESSQLDLNIENRPVVNGLRVRSAVRPNDI